MLEIGAGERGLASRSVAGGRGWPGLFLRRGLAQARETQGKHTDKELVITASGPQMKLVGFRRQRGETE